LGILDQTYFNRGDPDGKELLDALLTLYYQQQKTISVVQEAGMKPSQFCWNDPMEDVWPEILEKAAATQTLLRLIKVISEDSASTAYPVFRRLLERPVAARPIDPYLACLLGTGNRHAFIDRSMLRDHVRDMADPDGPRVLIVTGPSCSGKSYSWYLINHVRREGEFSPHPVNFSQWSGPPAGPADVMRLVAATLCWEAPPVDHTALDDAQARTLLYWFIGKMAKEPGRTWLIFDGLLGPTVTDAALRLIEGIATAAEQGTAGELRVVLIEYSRSLPQDVDPYALREPIKQVGVTELRAFFQNAAHALGAELDDGALDLLVQQVLGPPPHPQVISLAKVSALAANLARRSFQVNGAHHG
jgi:hypothetical protein